METNPFYTDTSEIGKVVKGPGFNNNGLSSLDSANEAMNQIMGTARTLASQTQNQQEITNDEGNLNDLEAKADSLINSGQYGRGRVRGSRGTSSYWQ